jgi:hypothetical protein
MWLMTSLGSFCAEATGDGTDRPAFGVALLIPAGATDIYANRPPGKNIY